MEDIRLSKGLTSQTPPQANLWNGLFRFQKLLPTFAQAGASVGDTGAVEKYQCASRDPNEDVHESRRTIRPGAEGSPRKMP
jgi:hypothetical protein